MTEEEIIQIMERQRTFFRSGSTLDAGWRVLQLKKLQNALKENADALSEALYQDLRKSRTEAWLTDIGPSLAEIGEMIKGTKKWAKPETHYSGITCFPSLVTKVYKMPYGVTLIISPFNFPVLLTLSVLAASLSAGNTAVLKLSSKSKHCSKAIRKMIEETFPEEYVCVIEGGHDVADLCLKQRFDKIFYTGSPKVGRHILEEAAKNLTPVALELGGETGNWCIVRKDADLKDAAEKIAFFKLCNAGQICIDINNLAVAKEVADDFLEELKNAFTRQIGEDPLRNEEYPRLIGEAAYEKCADEARRHEDRIVFGGSGDRDSLKFEPTVIYPVNIDEEIVQHELFCPLLPVVPYEDDEIDELLDVIAKREHGLALYLFTKDVKWAEGVMSSRQYGGGCVNEVCMQLMVKGVPFNGTGHSGMGAYHGEWGFREFSHPQTVLYGKTRFNLPLRKHPYDRWKQKILEFLER